ncbi:site-2 protease family protein [Sporosarcina sp. JAI121]|uniref:site-2 protease family protein n=1 Tax=Sporosarcina sp. JAI121 TaxID=2723064 RepID=UPI0015C6BCD4|nr:site-2 protease family protein [Sporosarcina sp. JAI121]NYF25005.1 stage IV sporulation protein FB [Sporosarcina sp. JAI121]
MKFRLHPVLLPFFIFLIVTGSISVYAIIFLSLLIHEAGHLIAAYLTGMRIRSCTIMPYGGEIVIKDRHSAPKKDRIIVALSGPLATLALLLAGMTISFPGDDLVVRIQVALLLLNLLPVLPLDGGQAICALLEKEGSEYRTRSFYLLHSIIFISVVVILLFSAIPDTLPYILLALFLLFQNISVFRFRKYEKAFADMKLNRLT